MKVQQKQFGKLVPLALLLLVIPLSSCQVEKEQAAELPDVDVAVDPGQLPEYDIKGPDVNIGVTERTVTVPKVVVIQEEETVKVPYINVDVPGADREERTITAEVEVPSGGYALEIRSIAIVSNQLWVVSELNETDANAPQKSVRVSDRVVINAPDMPVRHYIVGDRPSKVFNEQYTFIKDRNQIATQLDSGRVLYGEKAG